MSSYHRITPTTLLEFSDITYSQRKQLVSFLIVLTATNLTRRSEINNGTATRPFSANATGQTVFHVVASL